MILKIFPAFISVCVGNVGHGKFENNKILSLRPFVIYFFLNQDEEKQSQFRADFETV